MNASCCRYSEKLLCNGFQLELPYVCALLYVYRVTTMIIINNGYVNNTYMNDAYFWKNIVYTKQTHANKDI